MSLTPMADGPISKMGLVIAAAQTKSHPGDIPANIAHHVEVARCAHRYGAQFVVFPELSLTGYELALASRCALEVHDDRLQPLRDAAVALRLTLVAGAPLTQPKGQLHMGALIFHANGECSIYRKQHVHSSEQPPFVSGPGGPLIALPQGHAALAICRDASMAEHAARAAQRGASIYAASVMIDEAGHATKCRLLQQFALQHGIAILMANYSGVTGNQQSAGRSAIWTESGDLLAACPDAQPALVIGSSAGKCWTGVVVSL